MAHRLNEAVGAEQSRVESIARQLAGIDGVEYDDLVQEGLIAVWLSLENGVAPTNGFIRNRMLNWVKFVRRQLPADYQDILPLDTVPELAG